VALFGLETFSKARSGFWAVLVKLIVVIPLLFVLASIVAIRNHYTIDVVLATVFTNALWLIYTGFDHLSRMGNRQFVDSLIGRIFRRIEDVPIGVQFAAAEDGAEAGIDRGMIEGRPE
jgi:hypothetical protein